MNPQGIRRDFRHAPAWVAFTCASLVGAPSALAEEAVTAGLTEQPASAQVVPTLSEERPEDLEEDEAPMIGILFDVGLPDGVNLGGAVRPWSWLRVHAGASFNLAGWGVRGGATYIPFDYWVVPTAVLEGGYFFTGNAQEALDTFAGIETDYAPQDVRYGYVNAHVGLEFGGDWFTIFLRGGYSYIDATVRPPDVPEEGVRFDENTHITAWVPSAKLGLIVYVY